MEAYEANFVRMDAKESSAARSQDQAPDRRQRLADNEVVFRDVNERVQIKANGWETLGAATHRVVCECASHDCTEPIALTLTEYQMVRRHERWFVVAPHHDVVTIERVVYRHNRYWVVEKHGDLDIASS